MKSTLKTNQLRLYFFAIATLFAFTINNCSKEDAILLDGTDDLSAVSTNAKKINADIIVYPSGDVSGVTDVISVENALASLSSGDILLLESGSFYINRTIVAPVGFNGTVRGISMDETHINPVGDDTTPYELSPINVADAPIPLPSSAILFFPDPTETLNVSHFSSTLPDAFATDINFFGSQDLTSFITISFANNQANTHVSDLRLVGTHAHPSSAPFFIHQPNNGVQVLGNGTGFPSFVTGGTHTLSGCSITKVGIQASVYQLLKEAEITVSGNSFSDIKQTIYRYLDGCVIDVVNNEMDTSSFGAIVVTQEFFPVSGASNVVHIHKNKVTTAGFTPIEIGGIPAGGAHFDLLIEKNKLTNFGLDPLGFFSNFSGIAIFEGNDGAIVQNNQIRGEAEVGILTFSNDGLFRGNNLQGLVPIEASYALFGNNNTLIGIGNSTVLDNGINNNYTGMKMNSNESIIEIMRDYQAKKKEFFKGYKNY